MSYNPDNLQPWVSAVTGAMTGLALLAVGLRMLARYERKQKLWWDDWMILFSMVWIPFRGTLCRTRRETLLLICCLARTGLEPSRRRVHLCNGGRRHGLACRYDTNRKRRHDRKAPRRR